MNDDEHAKIQLTIFCAPAESIARKIFKTASANSKDSESGS